MAEAAEFFARHAGMAYGLALGVTGEPAAAEDVVQEAFMRLIRQRTDLGAAGAREYLAGAVLNTARNWRRGEARRKERERAAASTAATGAGAAASAEDRQAVRAALAALDEPRRLPVQLHVVEDFSQREVARILELPVSTVSHRINAGLDEMRAALARAGLSALAAPALLAALQTGCRMAAPAALVGRLAEMAAFVKPAAAVGGVVKGGLIVKIGLGIAAAGLVAGTTFWAVGGKSEESAKPPNNAQAAPEKQSKFPIPVWSPDARWAKEPNPYCSLHVGGAWLDGPVNERLSGTSVRPATFAGIATSARWAVLSYDRKTARLHGVTPDGVPGLLDGPFSRARFTGTEYSPRQNSTREVQTPDGRYAYLICDAARGTCLRCVDFVEQKVTTLPTGGSAPRAAISTDGEGRAYVVNGSYELLVLDPKTGWKPGQPVKLKEEESLGGGGISCCIAADEVHGRLYATTFGAKKWYVWYWDMKDGSFHGVMPLPPGLKGIPTPELGSYVKGEGVQMYNEGTVAFGPDDPEKRFLYLGRVDDLAFYRLDLVKEEIGMFDPAAGMFTYQPNTKHEYTIAHGLLPTWLDDGSFVSDMKPYRIPGVGYKGGYFRRVK